MISVLMTLLSSFAFAQGHVVGNPADGFVYADRVLLRDLVESGLEDGGWIGSESETVVAGAVDFVPLSVPFPKDLLAAKLTDMNRVSPGFGDHVLAAMKLYTWSFVDVPLGRIPGDDGSVIELPRGATFAQLANRLGATVRVHKPSWDRMPPRHQVALLLHEAVFGLLIPERTAAGFEQSARKAREIVAGLFSRDFALRGPAFVEHAAKPALALPWALTDPRRRHKLTWELRFARVSLLAPAQQRFETLLAIAADACRNVLADQAKTGRVSPLVSRLERPVFRARLETYPSPFGAQNRAIMEPRSGSLTDELTLERIWSSTDDCVEASRPVIETISSEI